jgi:hypothetical protein
MPTPNSLGSFADADPSDRLRLLQILLEYLPAQIYALDLEGRILLASRSMEKSSAPAQAGWTVVPGRTDVAGGGRSPPPGRSGGLPDRSTCDSPWSASSARTAPNSSSSPSKCPGGMNPVRSPASRASRPMLDRIHLIENRLVASEAHHRLLFEQNPQPMWVFDRETRRFLAVNAAAVGVYGFSRGEFLSMNLDQIRPPEDIPLLHERIASLRDGSTSSAKPAIAPNPAKHLDVEIHSHALIWEGRARRLRRRLRHHPAQTGRARPPPERADVPPPHRANAGCRLGPWIRLHGATCTSAPRSCHSTATRPKSTSSPPPRSTSPLNCL